MATDQITEPNYVVTTNGITLFGVNGIRLSDESWAIGHIECDPESIMDEVRTCIEIDVEHHNGDKIAQLHLSPLKAVVFFLENGITRKHFSHAVDHDDFIEIPDVEVEGRVLTVRVIEDPLNEVTTADEDGNVLP